MDTDIIINIDYELKKVDEILKDFYVESGNIELKKELVYEIIDRCRQTEKFSKDLMWQIIENLELLRD